jgi:hypothetical protein
VTQTKTGRHASAASVRLILTVLILVVIVFLAYIAYTFSSHPPEQRISPASSRPRATIVDHLSLTFPNQTFKRRVTDMLEQAGYTVDYYPGEEVTVELYRNLPTYGYSIIVLRVHSAADVCSGQKIVSFFTSELYSENEYVFEQLTQQVGNIGYYNGSTAYFGISQHFIRLSMNGQFQDAIVIAMGCDSLKYVYMAQAFNTKGAKVYIGWTNSVSASRTDHATTFLLQQLVEDKQTIDQAVENTIKEVGRDTVQSSRLMYSPSHAGNQTIGNIKSNY